MFPAAVAFGFQCRGVLTSKQAAGKSSVRMKFWLSNVSNENFKYKFDHGGVGEMGGRKIAERCGAPVGRWKNQGICGRPAGHPGVHNSVEALSRNRAYFGKRYRGRHAAIDAYKLSKGCIDCGYREDPCALDLDHRDADSKMPNFESLLNFGWPAIVKEIKKCDVRCANCHRIRTYRVQGLGWHEQIR